MNNAQSRFAIQHSFSTMTKPAIGRFAQHERGQPVRLTPCIVSGEAGIRTLGRLAPTPVFKTGAIDRSATSPIEAFRVHILCRIQSPVGAGVLPGWSLAFSIELNLHDRIALDYGGLAAPTTAIG